MLLTVTCDEAVVMVDALMLTYPQLPLCSSREALLARRQQAGEVGIRSFVLRPTSYRHHRAEWVHDA